MLDKLERYLNKNGIISIFSGFSENDYNIYVKYKKKNEKEQSGLNMHSLTEIEEYFKQKNYKVSIEKFMPSENLKKENNPLSSFTLYDQQKNKLLANNLNIIRRFYFIKAKKL